jgi:hypothetical protein
MGWTYLRRKRLKPKRWSRFRFNQNRSDSGRAG